MGFQWISRGFNLSPIWSKQLWCWSLVGTPKATRALPHWMMQWRPPHPPHPGYGFPGAFYKHLRWNPMVQRLPTVRHWEVWALEDWKTGRLEDWSNVDIFLVCTGTKKDVTDLPTLPWFGCQRLVLSENLKLHSILRVKISFSYLKWSQIGGYLDAFPLIFAGACRAGLVSKEPWAARKPPCWGLKCGIPDLTLAKQGWGCVDSEAFTGEKDGTVMRADSLSESLQWHGWHVAAGVRYCLVQFRSLDVEPLMSRDMELERDTLHFGKETRSQWHASQHAVFTFSSWQSQVALRKSGRQQLWNMFLLTCPGAFTLVVESWVHERVESTTGPPTCDGKS